MRLFIGKCLVSAILLGGVVLTVHADQRGLDYPHNSPRTITCNSCHYIVGETTPPWLAEEQEDIDDTLCNKLCWSCHNGGIARYEATHSSLTTSEGHGEWSIECRACHWPHHQKQLRTYGSASYLLSGTSAEVHTYTLRASEVEWQTDSLAGNILIPDTTISGNKYSYQYKIDGNTSDTITVEQSIDTVVKLAGKTFALIYGRLVNSSVNLAGITTIAPKEAKTGKKTVRLFRSTGPNSFADGDTTYDGVCEVCHTETEHYRNDGGASDQDHANLGGKNGSDCLDCHAHTGGFKHGGTSGCGECHGHDPGSPYDDDMVYPNDGSGDGQGGTCKGAGSLPTQSHSTHTETTGDDLRGPGIYCDTCHDIGNMPKFKNLDGTGNHTFTETDICNNCHSPGGTYDGVNDSVFGAKANWEAGIYDGNGLKAGKEKWCVTCHDKEPADSRYNGTGVDAPNIAGDEDGVYTYGTGWGFYKTGHGLPAGEAYPYKGGLLPPPLVNGATRAVECGACHNLASAHIDHNARTFDDGGSSTLDSSYYRTGYRLKQVSSGTGAGTSGKEPVLAPRPINSGNTANQARLCYNCHDSAPFIEDNNPDTNLKTDTDPNIHEYHMVMNQIKASTDFSGGDNSRMTCLTCHDVHGSTRLAMVRDGRLINREPGLEIWYHNDAIVNYNPNNDDPPVPASLPLAASTGTLWIGNSSSRLCTHCHGDITVNAEYRAPFQALAQDPTLTWTGESNYTSDGANPDSGVNGANFAFRVKYIDTNNDPPTSIQVWIDDDNDGYEPGEQYAMSQVDAGDDEYFDGKLYTYSRVLNNTAGNVKPYRFYALSNGVEASGPPVNSGSVHVLESGGSGSGSAPLLAWTGEPNYMADGVDPDSAVSGSTFTFRVKYTDADNNPPVQIEVWIDQDKNGAFSAAEKFSMTEEGGGADYIAGRFFTKSLALTGAGSISYRFHATDGNSLATGTPVTTQTVTVANNVPALVWTGEANYTTDGVNPNSGAGGTAFIYRVKYSDADNTAPASIQVWVDTDNSGTYDAHEKLVITQDDDDGDALFSNGEKYSKTVTIPFIGDGAITYRFYASDGDDSATGDAVSDKDMTITAPIGNAAPTLAWTGANCLSAGVRPATGADGTDFEFKVVYTDSDPGQCASEILLYLDADDNGSYVSAEKYVLTGDPGDSDCTDGRLYQITLTLANAGDGVLNYMFYATDGYQAATGVATTDSPVTVLNAIKVRPSGGDGWYSSLGEAIDNSATGSTILVYPNDDFSSAIYNENISLISADSDDLTFKSTCGADFTTIASAGGGTTFSVQDASNFVLDGFTITGATSFYGIIINRTDATTATIKNCKIHDNSHGIYINDSDDVPVRIENVEIYNNSTRGITLVSSDDDADIINSTIHSHNAVSGGAIAMNNSNTVTITNSIIRDNIVSGEGGAIYINLGSLTITNSIFSGNRAGTNGGVIRTNNGPTISIVNSTFADNQGTNGGVFYICAAGSTTIRNSIFWNNTSTSGNGANIYKGCGAGNIGTISDSDITTSSPSIYNASITDRGGIVSPAADPFFQGLGNYHLQSGSPVKDLANAAYAPDDDIDGDQRPLDAGDDLGADEYNAADLVPVLAWTGETSYTTDGVNPDTGASGGNFVFRVKYTDAEDAAPSTIQVWVDLDDDGSYEANEKYDMTQADITDITHANSKVYCKTLSLNMAGDGNLSYRFFAMDKQKNATGTPNGDSTVTISISNNPPVGGYTVDNVIPAAQINQAQDGTGLISINWKGRDDESNNVRLKTFAYSVDGGSTWSGPSNGDNSAALSSGWTDNGGSGWTTAATLGAASSHSFTFNTKHVDVTGLDGVDQNDVHVRFLLNDGTVDSAAPATSESFPVDDLAPIATITAASYDSGTNTMTVTGTSFETIAAISTDIKGYVDWSKLVWDINGDDGATANISFSVSDVSSLTVTNATTLTLVFASAKATAIEATAGYGATGGADTLDVTAGFAKDVLGNAATTDGVSNAALAVYPNALAWYKFDEASGTTAQDSIGSHNGTLVNGGAWKPGVSNNSVGLNQNGSYVNIGTFAASTAKSFEFWIKPGYFYNDNRLLCQLSGAASQAGALRFYYGTSQTNDGTLQVWNGSAWQTIIPSGSGMVLDTWYHIVVTYDGTNAIAYLNGIQKNSTACASFASTGVQLGLGAKFLNSFGNTVGALLDEVVIYDTALTLAQVQERYAVLSGSVTPVGPVMAYWNFDEASGTAAQDSIGPHDGVVSGAGTWSAAVVNNGINLGASGSYVNVGSFADTANKSFEFWVKPGSLNDNRLLSPITGGVSYGNNPKGSLRFHNGNQLQVYDGGAWQTLVPSGLSAGTWSHLIVAYNGTTATAFLNGGQQNSYTGAPFQCDSLQVGLGAKWLTTGGNTLAGVLDEVRMYNHAMNLAEVQARYAIYSSLVIPVGGYTADNVILAAQVSQATDGSGVLTISWKGREGLANNVTLKTFQYSVDGGSTWAGPSNGDNSAALSANWKDNGGAGWSTAPSFDAATAHSLTFNTKHADATGLNGVDQADVRIRFTLADGANESVAPVTSESFQVDDLAPTVTITSGSYNAGTDTLTITGANFTTIAAQGTDVKGYVDWNKLVWDINGDNATTVNISFSLDEVTSLIVTNATTLALVFTSAKATAIEATAGYGSSGGADTLDVTAGFSRDAFGNAATTDAVADGLLGFSGANAVPTLDWATANCLTNGVRPSRGEDSQAFEFTVIYTDADDEDPSPIQVWVDLNDDGDYLDANEKVTMSVAAGEDGSYINGEKFTVSISTLTAGVDNILKYRFYASDGTDVATGAPSTEGATGNSTVAGDQNVYVYAGYTVRPSGTALPKDYTTITSAIAMSGNIVVYPNDNYTAATYSESVNLMNKNDRTLISACGPESTIIDGATYSVLLQTSYNIVLDGFSHTGSTYGIQANGNTTATIKNCDIYNNTSRGINVSSGTNVTLTVSGCDIYSNSGASGEGIYLAGGTITVENAKIYNNSGTGSGTLYQVNATTTFKNVIMTGNTAYDGGAAYFNSGTFNCYNCTISGNKATNVGGGLRVASTTVTIRNSIVYNNDAGNANGGDELYLVSGSTAADYSFIKTGAPYIQGAGSFTPTNIISDDSNLLFMDKRDPSTAPTLEGDYHLRINSPCIDSGTSTNAVSPDIDGDPRFQGGGYDMGADEYVP